MSGFELQSLDIDDISRAAKQNVRVDVQYNTESVDTDAPLKGITKKQRTRNSDIADILDIGAGTCDRPMEYNLGSRNEEARL